MSIRFAAPVRTLRQRMLPHLVRSTGAIAANDNLTAHDTPAALNAALRHFAQHGMAAARIARQSAEEAHRAGNQREFEWWLGICRTLDRRLGNELAAYARNFG